MKEHSNQTDDYFDEEELVPTYVRYQRYKWPELLFILALTIGAFLLPAKKIALDESRVAKPEDSLLGAVLLEEPESFCLTGEFQDWDGEANMMVDDGTSGDRVAGDGIYSLSYPVDGDETQYWMVIACGDWDVQIPHDSSAWLTPTQAIDSNVLFTINTNTFPVYQVNASEVFAGYTVVGEFQEWDVSSLETQMEEIQDGIYELRYRVAVPDKYTARVVASDSWLSFGANGRSSDIVELEFKTESPNELVIFQFDANIGQFDIYYEIPHVLSLFAFSGGAQLLAALFAVIFLFNLFRFVRLLILNRPHLWIKAGCPECGHEDFNRIRRKYMDRFMKFMGFPLRRYHCTNCDWVGSRFRRREKRGWALADDEFEHNLPTRRTRRQGNATTAFEE